MKELYQHHDTGLDVIKTWGGELDMPLPLRVSQTLKWLERDGRKLAFDKSKKRHVRFIAKQAAVHAAMIRDRLRNIVKHWNQPKGTLKPLYRLLLEATNDAFAAGYYFSRLTVVDAEADAVSGSKSRQAAQKRGRNPPERSVRASLNKIPEWQKAPVSKLVGQLDKEFPTQSKEDLSRQIRRIKKRDTKP